MDSLASIRRTTVAVEGMQLSALEAGEPGKSPVLLLHGWPTSAQLWRHALPLIGTQRHAIALDLPGFGESSKPLDASYSFRFYDRVLSGLLDALQVDRTGLVVHDLGGPIGLYWALEHRERLTDLVMLNTVVFPEMSWAVKVFVGASYLPGVRELLSSPRGIAWAMRLGVVNRSKLPEDVLELYRAPFASRSARRALLKAAHGLHPAGFTTLAEGLGELDVPVSLIYGERDRILPDIAITMRRVQEIIPHASCVSIPECGHFLQEDRPDEVNEHLMRALCEPVLA